jgi:hypothetical protein
MGPMRPHNLRNFAILTVESSEMVVKYSARFAVSGNAISKTSYRFIWQPNIHSRTKHTHTPDEPTLVERTHGYPEKGIKYWTIANEQCTCTSSGEQPPQNDWTNNQRIRNWRWSQQLLLALVVDFHRNAKCAILITMSDSDTQTLASIVKSLRSRVTPVLQIHPSHQQPISAQTLAHSEVHAREPRHRWITTQLCRAIPDLTICTL